MLLGHNIITILNVEQKLQVKEYNVKVPRILIGDHQAVYFLGYFEF